MRVKGKLKKKREKGNPILTSTKEKILVTPDPLKAKAFNSFGSSRRK